MHSQPGSPRVYAPPWLQELPTEEARKLSQRSLATWLVTVALVTIVIGIALALAASGEQKKQIEGTAAHTTAFK